MNTFYFWITVALAIAILLPFYRVYAGPTVYDRLLAVSAIGGKITALICLFGMLFDRPDMFVDIVLAYAMLNFIGGIVVAEYFRMAPERR